MKYRIVKVESGAYRIQHLPDSFWRFIEYEDFDGDFDFLEGAKEALDGIIEEGEWQDKRNKVVETCCVKGSGWLDKIENLDEINDFTLTGIIAKHLFIEGPLRLTQGHYLYNKVLIGCDDSVDWEEFDKKVFFDTNEYFVIAEDGFAVGLDNLREVLVYVFSGELLRAP